MSSFAAFQRWLHLKQYHLELTLSVYMFTPWEKFAFYSIFFLLFSLTFIAATLYLPHHISFLISRAWYYMHGEHIDVAASAREVVKEMSASVVSGVGTGTAAGVVEETVGTVLKEL